MCDTDVEIRPIEDCPGYAATSDGRILSYLKYGKNPEGKFRETPREIKGSPDKDGYIKIMLTVAGKKIHKRVHNLVLETFIGPCPEGMVGCHKDGVRNNNRLDNLCWKTQKDNIADKLLHGTHQWGSRVGTSRLTEEQVLEIRRRWAAGERPKNLMKDFGITQGCYYSITRRWSWKFI